MFPQNLLVISCVYFGSFLEEYQFPFTDFWNISGGHDFLFKRIFSHQQTFWWHITLPSYSGIDTIILSVDWSSQRESFFIAEPNSCYSVDENRSRSRRQHCNRCSLFLAVRTWTLLRLNCESRKSCLMMRLTLERDIPVSLSISLGVEWECCCSSWLRISSSTRSQFSSVRTLFGLPLPGLRAQSPVLSIVRSRSFSVLDFQFFQGNSFCRRLTPQGLPLRWPLMRSCFINILSSWLICGRTIFTIKHTE